MSEGREIERQPMIESAQELIRELVTDTCDPEVFGRMTLDDKRNYQMLVTFGFLITGGHAHGINALIPAEKMCKATQIGTGWFQISKTRTALVRAVHYLGVPWSDRQDTETLKKAALLCMQELRDVNS
jgi:hypothetical protein